jgi:hypothetical protein
MFKELCKELDNKSHSMICINDTINTEDFESKKNTIISLFEKNLPYKSTFEK